MWPAIPQYSNFVKSGKLLNFVQVFIKANPNIVTEYRARNKIHSGCKFSTILFEFDMRVLNPLATSFSLSHRLADGCQQCIYFL